MKTQRVCLWIAVTVSLATMSVVSPEASARPGITTRVSVNSAGAQGNNFSDSPTISSDGRYVAFDSFASNLVPGDTNGITDVFVHDRKTRVIIRVSVDSLGNQGDGESYGAAISANGRFVAFHSSAPNLVAGDTNGVDDVFVHDRRTGVTTRVSVDSAGVEGNDASGARPAMTRFFRPAISRNGRFVAFHSFASNLVARDTNTVDDVFVHDGQTGITTRVSVSSAGAEGNSGSTHPFAPAISADGRLIAFQSFASTLVPGDRGRQDIFVHDRLTGTTTRISKSIGPRPEPDGDS